MRARRYQDCVKSAAACAEKRSATRCATGPGVPSPSGRPLTSTSGWAGFEVAARNASSAAISAAALAAAGTGWAGAAVAEVPTDEALLAAAARLCD